MCFAGVLQVPFLHASAIAWDVFRCPEQGVPRLELYNTNRGGGGGYVIGCGGLSALYRGPSPKRGGHLSPLMATPTPSLMRCPQKKEHVRRDNSTRPGAVSRTTVNFILSWAASRTLVLLSPCVFPSLSSASVLGALLLSPSLTIVRSPAATRVRPVWYGPRDATQYGVIAPFPLVTTSSRRGMEATALRSVFW